MHAKKEQGIDIPIEDEEKHIETDESVNNDEIKDSRSEDEQEEPDYLDQLKRLQAEFANYRKRTEKEWSMVFVRAKADMAEKLLPVLDDFERLTDHHEEDKTAPMDGVLLIKQKLEKTLQNEGLERIEALNQPFNTDFHEAVGVEEVDEELEDMVVADWQKGYKLGDVLIRPSRVKVGRCTNNQQVNKL